MKRIAIAILALVVLSSSVLAGTIVVQAGGGGNLELSVAIEKANPDGYFNSTIVVSNPTSRPMAYDVVIKVGFQGWTAIGTPAVDSGEIYENSCIYGIGCNYSWTGVAYPGAKLSLNLLAVADSTPGTYRFADVVLYSRGMTTPASADLTVAGSVPDVTTIAATTVATNPAIDVTNVVGTISPSIPVATSTSTPTVTNTPTSTWTPTQTATNTPTPTNTATFISTPLSKRLMPVLMAAKQLPSGFLIVGKNLKLRGVPEDQMYLVFEATDGAQMSIHRKANEVNSWNEGNIRLSPEARIFSSGKVRAQIGSVSSEWYNY